MKVFLKDVLIDMGSWEAFATKSPAWCLQVLSQHTRNVGGLSSSTHQPSEHKIAN